LEKNFTVPHVSEPAPFGTAKNPQKLQVSHMLSQKQKTGFTKEGRIFSSVH
jgi:hypothetical protein